MKRTIINSLREWQTSPGRMPLLLRGPRQVGKTYVVEQFAKEYFESFVNINFEFKPEFSNCFTTLEPKNIIEKLTLLTGQKIVPGNTLVFFDEIQECPQAIKALRYFKEQFPELHVMGAGSLLELVFNSEEFSMPVGRVQFLYLYPLSFNEFVLSLGHESWLQYLNDVTLASSNTMLLHQPLLELLRKYLILGGMPAVVEQYVRMQDMMLVQRMQSALLQTYRGDFGKYAKHTKTQYLQLLLDKLPNVVAKQFKYVDIDPSIHSREIKYALQALRDAGLLRQIFNTAASGLPLRSQVDEKKFKLMMVDVGLMRHDSQVNANILLQENLLQINQGAIVEQFVAQELIAYSDPYQRAELFYWERGQKNSSAEVDYLSVIEGHIVPIEVKAGSAGRLKSLRQFMLEKSCKLGVKISQQELSYKDSILSLPLYMISELPRLVRALL